MQDVTTSYHFAPVAEVPLVEESVSFLVAFELLREAQRGAFILARNGTPRAFVRGQAFANEVLARAAGSIPAYERLTKLPIGDLLQEGSDGDALVRIGATVGRHQGEEGLRSLSETVFAVEHAGRRLGWYLNHETVREATTARVWFMCANPQTPHKNATPDHGYCQQCPYQLAGLDKGT
jgi:hypothetical protein